MKRVRLVLILALGIVLVSGCGKSEYADIAEAIRAGAVLGENIEIDGMDVSGMEVVRARRALSREKDAYLASLQYEVHAGEGSVHVSAAELGASSDLDDVLLRALCLAQYYPSANKAREFHTSVSIDEQKLKKQAENIAAALNVAPQNATAVYDARAEGGFLYTESIEGFSVDAERLADQLKIAVLAERNASIEPYIDTIPAEYTAEHARADTQLITEFSTSFKSATYGKANRVFNIAKAAELIDGTTIAPGEEFDMNAILGPRNAENGWKEATGIRDAVYVQEYGGGVCQVSSTLYNAVLMADLRVTDRTHHSWPLGYVDIGRDATISTGGPNFKFQNTQEVPITIGAQTDKEKKKITISVYGRPLADGVTIQISSKKVETLPEPETEVIVDESLAPGIQQVVREPRRGSVAVTYKEYYDANGNLLHKEQVTKDKYRSIKGITHVGPGGSATSAEIAP